LPSGRETDDSGNPTADIDPLVARTSGAQPWRRIFHATSGVAVAAILALLEPSRRLAVEVGVAALAVQLLLDWARLRIPSANALFFRAFRHLASPREARGVASSTWFTLGIVMTVAFFPRPAAVSGILVLALADPTAGYLGRRYGRIPWLGGTLEGTLVFAAVCFAVLFYRHGPLVAVVSSLLLPLVERRSWPLDDNVSVPLASAALVTLLATMT
jgi:dolichol kinase